MTDDSRMYLQPEDRAWVDEQLVLAGIDEVPVKVKYGELEPIRHPFTPRSKGLRCTLCDEAESARRHRG